jgi:hypothetical protein
MRSIHFGGDVSQRLEELEQANIFVVIAIKNGKGIVGSVGVNGDPLFVGRAVQ